MPVLMSVTAAVSSRKKMYSTWMEFVNFLIYGEVWGETYDQIIFDVLITHIGRMLSETISKTCSMCVFTSQPSDDDEVEGMTSLLTNEIQDRDCPTEHLDSRISICAHSCHRIKETHHRKAHDNIIVPIFRRRQPSSIQPQHERGSSQDEQDHIDANKEVPMISDLPPIACHDDRRKGATNIRIYMHTQQQQRQRKLKKNPFCFPQRKRTTTAQKRQRVNDPKQTKSQNSAWQ